MTDTPAPLPEELTLSALLETATQLAIDFAATNSSLDPASLNMIIQGDVRRMFREEGGERAYEFLKMGALFSMRRQGLGSSLSGLQRDWEPS